MKRCWVEVDLGILEGNVKRIRDALRPETEPMLVVKANAYGHGAVPVAERAVRAGINWFAVAYLEEALALRKVITGGDILILGVVDPIETSVLAEHRIMPVVADLEHGRALAAEARARHLSLPVHVKIDTGMGRIGLPWKRALDELLVLSTEEGLVIKGLCSHFAMVEDSEPQAARTQADRFTKITQQFEEETGRHYFKHISSSRALLYHKEWDLDGVRPGIMIYGYGASDDDMRLQTNPILQWKTHVMQVKSVPADFAVGYYSTYVTSRPTDIAIIACGYADGYLRALSNRGHVLIGGRRCPVVGRVSMNWIAADLGPRSGVKRGDEVVLLGQQGKETVWANELAAICRTIPYEILTGIDSSIEHRYVN